MGRIMKIFGSVKTTVFLIFFLCIFSLIGILLPQGLEAQDYHRLYPSAAKLILALGAEDIFRSPVFLLILVLSLVSTMICTASRFSISKDLLFNRLELATPLDIRSLPVKLDLEFSPPAQKPQNDWESKVWEDGTKMYLRSYGRISLIGSLLIGIGIIAVLLGSLIDTQLGINTLIRAREGEKIPIPKYVGIRAGIEAERLSHVARNIQFQNPNDPKLEPIRNNVKSLSDLYQKSLSNPSFKISFENLSSGELPGNTSSNSRDLGNCKSQVTFLKNGQKIASAVISMNEPATFDEFFFHQNGWQKKYTEIIMTVSLRDVQKQDEAKTFPLVASLSVPVKPEWASYTFVVMNFWPDFKIEKDRFISLSDELNNPAAQVAAYDISGKAVGRAWAFSKPMQEASGLVSDIPFEFLITGAKSIDETVIQMTYHPGIPLFSIGFLLLVFGLALTLYFTYFEEWFIERMDGRIIIAVTGNRPDFMLKKRLVQLAVSYAPSLVDRLTTKS